MRSRSVATTSLGVVYVEVANGFELRDVLDEGDESQRQQAQQLLDTLAG